MADALSALAAVLRPGRGGVASGAPGVVIAERRPLTIVQVAEIPGIPGDRPALEKALGLALPPPRRAAAANQRAALWVGPGRWFAVEPGSAPLVAALERAAAASFALIDLSHARTVLRLTGPHALDVLAKGCAVDLHSGSIRAGDSFATGVARHAAVLHVVDATPTVDIYVYRSLGQDLFEWLAEAGAEFGWQIA
jgi:methylglutamate dehydrogenase subunit D